ncbi:fungal-specific transcription factor domain-containing protein [Bisporella sp. PMI_857]|nr:fungal-specific transcription factor domain-containing protein [Bisporella sp. PMI_857]
MPPRVRTVEGSCWACKERRVICDLKQPCCEKCIKSGRDCDYGKVRLRWTDCIASRGRNANRKVPIYNAPTIHRNNDHHILYFETELLPRFNLSNTVLNIDLKLLIDDPILFQSAVAVANAHHTYAYQISDDVSALSRIEDRKNALRIFRKHLMAANNDAIKGSLFMSNVLLCILDGIVEPNTESATTHHHLLGGKAILNHWGGANAIFQQKGDLPILMLSIFQTMDLTHALLIGDQPYAEVSSWAKFGGCEPWWGNVQSDDDFIETLSILTKLATLGHGVHNCNETVPIGLLLSYQMALEQQAKSQMSLDEKPPDKKAWTAFCSVYRLMASVYLYRALGSLDVDHHLVQQAVSACMEIIGGSDLTLKLHHCILFPVLVVGAHCLLKEQRNHIRKSIAQTATYLSFESLRSLESFLERQWVALDMKSESGERSVSVQSTWWTFFEEIAPSSCLF